MNNPPQQVTSRYVRNLLFKGSNNEFTITALTRLFHAVDTIIVGHYFEIEIIATNDQKKSAAGVTSEQAVHRCLEKHGVTFR